MYLESSDWIAVTNMIATLTLSIFVYKATKKSADATEETRKLTEESVKLSKLIHDIQQQESSKIRNSLRIQYTDILQRKTAKILNSITTHDAMRIHQEISKNFDSYHHGISPENLALSFNEEEVETINNAWTILNDYIDNYYSITYKGQDMGKLAEKADGPILAFEGVKFLLQDIRRRGI
ncbi:hypothetical protein [Paenibacillus massiliensis]|uniref:hypothetical protein n=1 Tax=Paenibacillus massiliensis TaxID=225917 RepID=UPI00048E6A26|nr:hypothetical protein [Paenibacillus massiliensis]